jgi:hypothetical protein
MALTSSFEPGASLTSSFASDVMTRGFSVLPGFLSEQSLAGFVSDYAQGQDLENKMYTLGFADPAHVEAIKPDIRTLLALLRKDCDVDINFIGGGAFFAIDNGIDFGWHQDHESYFLNQTHRNYLNFYIPVVKPAAEKTNLSIIPVDTFAARSPGLWQKLVWGGAATATFKDGRTAISDDCRGGVHGILDYDIEEMAETPVLAAGDALVLRGDVFHRTQDTETSRVALSVRMFNDTHQVSREHFQQTCEVKNWFMKSNAHMYDRVAKVFEEHESLTYRELMDSAWNL